MRKESFDLETADLSSLSACGAVQILPRGLVPLAIPFAASESLIHRPKLEMGAVHAMIMMIDGALHRGNAQDGQVIQAHVQLDG